MRTLLALSLLALGPGVVPGPATAETADVNREFLDKHLPAIEAIAEDESLQVGTPAEAFETVRGLLLLRRDTLLELDGTTPLSTFDGVATQDAFDDAVVRAIHVIASKATLADSAGADSDERFDRIMDRFPNLGEAPVAFMVLSLAEMAVTAGDSLWADPSLSRDAVANLALRLVRVGTQIYVDTHQDIFDRADSAKFYRSSVVYRLRCPKDGGSYTVNNMKNKIHEDNSISILYYLQCEICGEPHLLQFPQELSSRLNKMGDRQKIKRDVQPSKPSQGLDP